MRLSLDTIKNEVKKYAFISGLPELKEKDSYVSGRVYLMLEGLSEPLLFRFEISAFYPFKIGETETIRFYAENLRHKSHINDDNSLCIHTFHEPNPVIKLKNDFESLKEWVVKYIINDDVDAHYEHLIVPFTTVNETQYNYSFTSVNDEFDKNEYGSVYLTKLKNSIINKSKSKHFLIHAFINQKVPNKIKQCAWSSSYYDLGKTKKNNYYLGIYIFLETPPVKVKSERFILTDWIDYKDKLPQRFLDYLYKQINVFKGTIGKKPLPFFIGYQIPNNEIHWQVILLDVNNPNLKGFPESVHGKKTGRWNSALTEGKIDWGKTSNVSYEYFFGRGHLTSKITNSRVLIIGIGAVGSMVATTLARGGCRHITIDDFDIKKPENVCRSHYDFQSGIGDKTEQLKSKLIAISPFVNVQIIDLSNIAKLVSKEAPFSINKFANEFFDNFDIIFDCSTDDDLMFQIDQLKPDVDVINLSISNHAQHLVCGFSPNNYHYVRSQFENIIKQDANDLYKPTGCWDPTFKASYNDINVLVAFAIKKINFIYKKKQGKASFVLEVDEDNELSIKTTSL